MKKNNKFQIYNGCMPEVDILNDNTIIYESSKEKRAKYKIQYGKKFFRKEYYRKNKCQVKKEKTVISNLIFFWRKAQEKQNKDVITRFLDVYERMLHILESQKLYLDPNFTQKDLIQYLGTNRNYLYMAMKIHCDTNFRGLVNSYRIQHAQLLIQQKFSIGQKYLLSEIYADCGFATNESFYRTFKKILGISPGKYVTQIHKDVL